jgi:hypothetical protein
MPSVARAMAETVAGMATRAYTAEGVPDDAVSIDRCDDHLKRLE